MRKWNTPEVNELTFAMTADGNVDNDVEGVVIPCYSVATGNLLENCNNNITNKKCASEDYSS